MWFGYTSIITVLINGVRKNVGVLLIDASNRELNWKINDELVPNNIKLRLRNIHTKYETYDKLDKKIINQLKIKLVDSLLTVNFNEEAIKELNKKTQIGDLTISLPIWTSYGKQDIQKTIDEMFIKYVEKQEKINMPILNFVTDTKFHKEDGYINPIQPCVKSRKRGGMDMYVAIYNNVCNNKPYPLFADLDSLKEGKVLETPEACKNCEFSIKWTDDNEVEKAKGLFLEDMKKHPWWNYVGKSQHYQIKRKKCVDCGTMFVPFDISTNQEITFCINCNSHNLISSSIMDIKICPPKSNLDIYKSAENMSAIRNVFKKADERIKEEDSKMVFDEYKLFKVEVNSSKSDRDITYNINAKSAEEAKEKAILIYNNDGIVSFTYASVIGNPLEEDDFIKFKRNDYSKCDCVPDKEEIAYFKQEIKRVEQKYLKTQLS
jgi:hypothetical protein